MPIPIMSPLAGLLPTPIPSQLTQPIPVDDSRPCPTSHSALTRKTFYTPAHTPADPCHVSQRALVDLALDLGIPLESYRDLIDLIIHRPTADDIARPVALVQGISLNKARSIWCSN